MAWRIPESEIAAVKEKADLVALVQSRGIALKKHGAKDWVGLCPFHPDQETPNFIVSPQKGLFHCLGCGAAGNAIQFIQKHDGVSFRHAFEVLQSGGSAAFAARPKVTVSTVPQLPCPLDPDADNGTLCGQVAAYYTERLKATPGAREYLASRGLGDEALIDRYRLGFADRTLGLRLPDSNRVEGEKLRTRLPGRSLAARSGTARLLRAPQPGDHAGLHRAHHPAAARSAHPLPPARTARPWRRNGARLNPLTRLP